jgi:hypothetical protein
MQNMGKPRKSVKFSTPAQGELVNITTEKQVDTSKKIFVHMTMRNKLFNHVMPTAMFMLALTMLGTSLRSDISFTWNHLPELRASVVRTDWIRSTLIASAACFCSMYAAEHLRNGHLYTTSVQWCTDASLTPILYTLNKYGLNHIPAEPLVIDYVLDEYYKCTPLIAKLHNIDPTALWRTIRQLVCGKLHTISSDCESMYTATQIYQSAKLLTDRCVVCCVDKASNQPFFCCKKLMLQLTTDNLNSHAYSITNLTVAEVKKQLSSLCPLLTDDASDKPALMYPIPKYHKPGVTVRFITSACNTFVSKPAKLVHCMLQPLEAGLKIIATDLSKFALAHHGLDIRLNNIVHDGAHACANLPNKLQIPHIICADISKCFDEMITDAHDPDSITNVLAAGFHLLSLIQPDHTYFVKCDKDTFNVKYSNASEMNGYTRMTIRDLLDMFQTILTCTIIQVSNVSYVAKKGHPQGLAPGPRAINIYFLIKDIFFFLNNITYPTGRILLAKLYTLHFKFVDDLFFGNSHLSIADLKLVYPHFIKFEVTSVTDENGCVHGIFLNVGIIVYPNGKLEYFVVHKTDKLPFIPKQYVHFDSNRSIAFCQDIISGQLHNAVLMNSTIKHFCKHLTHILNIFCNNGFDFEKLLKHALKFYSTRDYSEVAKFEALKAFFIFRSRRN